MTENKAITLFLLVFGLICWKAGMWSIIKEHIASIGRRDDDDDGQA